MNNNFLVSREIISNKAPFIIFVFFVYSFSPVVTMADGTGSLFPSPTFTNFPTTIPPQPIDPGTVYRSLIEMNEEGFGLENTPQGIERGGHCAILSNQNKEHFVPTKKDEGWLSFLANKPADVTIELCHKKKDCYNDTIFEFRERLAHATGQQAFESVCYLDKDRKIECEVDGVPAYSFLNTAVTYEPSDMGIDTAIPYWEFHKIGAQSTFLNHSISREFVASAFCGIRADNLKIECASPGSVLTNGVYTDTPGSLYPVSSSSPYSQHKERFIRNHPRGQYTHMEIDDRGYNACALALDGSVDCWGAMIRGNPDSLLGPYVYYIGDLPSPSGVYTKLFGVADNMYCATKKSNGQLECWGQQTELSSSATVTYPPNTQSYVDVFAVGMKYSDRAVTLCGVTSLGNVVCPSDSVLSTSGGLTTTSISNINSIESNGPYDFIGTTYDPGDVQNKVHMSVLTGVFVKSTGQIYSYSHNITPTAGNQNSYFYTYNGPVWDDFEDLSLEYISGLDITTNLHSHLCGRVLGQTKCVLVDARNVGLPNSTVTFGQTKTYGSASAIGSFYSDTYCSTLD